MKPDVPKLTVYFDGACALCRAEIGYYGELDHAGALLFRDVSKAEIAPPEGLSRQRAMERFHVRTATGQTLSGAKAFVEVWTCLPGWRWLARAASLPGAMIILETVYRMFLRLRPSITCIVEKFHSIRRSTTTPNAVQRENNKQEGAGEGG